MADAIDAYQPDYVGVGEVYAGINTGICVTLPEEHAAIEQLHHLCQRLSAHVLITRPMNVA